MMIKNIILVLLLPFTLFFLYIRLAPLNGGKWFWLPNTPVPTQKPNVYQIEDQHSPKFDLSGDELFDVVADYIRAQPNVSAHDFDKEAGLLKVVQRTKLMGYPDYVVFKVDSHGANKSSMSATSRSRFGRSDFGANKQRIDSWVLGIKGLIGRD